MKSKINKVGYIKMDKYQKWNSMSYGQQLGNIGSEVIRALRYKNNEEKSKTFLNKALELLERTQADPKNINRIPELNTAKEELIDYFIEENSYNTTEENLIKFYDQYL